MISARLRTARYTGAKPLNRQMRQQRLMQPAARPCYIRVRPIYASFHTTSGGMTENSEDVWGSYLPYLRAVPDDDLATPYAKWEMQFTPQELTQKLNAAGLSIGNLAAIELSPLKEKLAANQDRSATGRIKTMRFIGDKGSVTLTGAKVRSALGLKSTLFDIRMIVPEEKKISVPIGQYYKKDIAVNLPPYEERGLYTDSENIRRISGREGELIAIDGRGWGHGLGMSQWGAQVMGKTARLSGDFASLLYRYRNQEDILGVNYMLLSEFDYDLPEELIAQDAL